MDIDDFGSAFLVLTSLAEKLRAIRESLPNTGEPHSALGNLLYVMECDVRATRAMLVGAPGFCIYRSCWPPELLVKDYDALIDSLVPLEGGQQRTRLHTD